MHGVRDGFSSAAGPSGWLGGPFTGQEREVTVAPTIHPSVLRAEDREAAYTGLVSDLRVAAAAIPVGRAED